MKSLPMRGRSVRKGRFGNCFFVAAFAAGPTRASSLNQPLTIASPNREGRTAANKLGTGNTRGTNQMTDTTIPPAATTTPSTASATASSTGLGNIAGNFNTFLTLLTTQLQHQDPLSPLDTNQFTQQLVQFASVEQQINMNTSLSTLISLQQTQQATSALNFLGATVVVGGNTAQLANGQATWNYSVASPATAAINVSNASGQLVYSTTQAVQPGTQTFVWNGRNSVGNVMPTGSYTAQITATGANGQPVQVTTQVEGVVSGVNVSANPITLTINGQSYPLSQITQVLSTGSTSSNPVSQAASAGQNFLNGLTNAITGH